MSQIAWVLYITFVVVSLAGNNLSVFVESTNLGNCTGIITKTEWGGRKAKQVQYAIAPLDYVIIHHSVTPSCNNLLECSQLLKSIQNFHMDNLHFGDIGYNFMVSGDGKIYEGRGWHKVGAHTKGYNSKSLAIAVLGTFTNKLPSSEQLQAAKNLIQCAVNMNEVKSDYKLYGARQLSKTQSPGLKLYSEIQNWPHFTETI